MACLDCTDPNNECSGTSSISLDSAISTCMASLGLAANQSLSIVISNLSDAICELQQSITDNITCEDMLVPETYENIGFVGTDTTTACNLFTAIDTRFGTIRGFTFNNCFGVGEDYNDAISAMMTQLCADLYTPDSELFLPIAGNSISNFQHNIFMLAAEPIYWHDTSGAQIAGFGSNTSFGLLFSGGINGSSHLNPLAMESPVKLFFANRVDFSTLTAGTTTLTQDTMKPLYIINKSVVNTVNLPQISTLNVSNVVVTFAGSVLGATVANCKIYSFAGETINGAASYNFGLVTDSITLLGTGTNWIVVQRDTF